MREMLEPFFGESGAVVAQFVITLVAVLVLIGIFYWLVQRFSGIRFAGAGRGRVPRLAVIDALSVDGRRKLVLVRRDNVEHLILIGGTSDLVVEPSIMRGMPAGARPRQGQPQSQPQPQRPQPQPQPAAASAAPQAAPQPQPQPHAAPQRSAETNGTSEPIPFPPQRQHARPAPAPRAVETPSTPPERPAPSAPEPAPQRRAALRAAAVPEAVAAAAGTRAATASARFEEPARPSRIESVFSLADALDEIANEPMPAGDVTEFAGPKARPRHFEEAAVAAEQASDETSAEPLDLSPEPAPAIATDDTTTEPAAEPEGQTGTKVSDLEREMARLLGEITSRRDS